MSSQSFAQQFGFKLAQYQRYEAFKLICEHLISLGRPVKIVETGCVRAKDNWAGDGQSTLIWDWVISQVGGSATSIDLDPQACETAIRLAPRAKVICGDSVDSLMYLTDKSEIDFLYLDSMDWDGTGESALHHLDELSVCWDHLKSGTLIAVDDCFDDGRGKGQMIRSRLDKVGIVPILDSYVTIWKKPESAPAWKEIDNASS
jgi:hypothetical protein